MRLSVDELIDEIIIKVKSYRINIKNIKLNSHALSCWSAVLRAPKSVQ